MWHKVISPGRFVCLPPYVKTVSDVDALIVSSITMATNDNIFFADKIGMRRTVQYLGALNPPMRSKDSVKGFGRRPLMCPRTFVISWPRKCVEKYAATVTCVVTTESKIRTKAVCKPEHCEGFEIH